MSEIDGKSESVTNFDIGVKLEANLNPLVNATPGALSTFFNLVFKNKYPEAARKALLASAQNHVDAKKILDGIASYDKKSGNLIESVKEHGEIRRLVRECLEEEEITNLICCTVHAANNEGTQNKVDDVSPEFLNRWRSEAKLLSDDAAQAMWGRILSEEVAVPKSIGLRTLEVIKNLSKEEAQTFQEACKFIFFGKYLLASSDGSTPLPEQTYETLFDAGLLANYQKGFHTSAKWLPSSITYESGPVEVYYLEVAGLFMHVEKAKVTQPPTVSYRELTKAGQEMYRIVSKNTIADPDAVGKVLVDESSALVPILRYAKYSNVQERLIDFNEIKNVF